MCWGGIGGAAGRSARGVQKGEGGGLLYQVMSAGGQRKVVDHEIRILIKIHWTHDGCSVSASYLIAPPMLYTPEYRSDNIHDTQNL